jgi:hypothetical protein
VDARIRITHVHRCVTWILWVISTFIIAGITIALVASISVLTYTISTVGRIITIAFINIFITVLSFPSVSARALVVASNLCTFTRLDNIAGASVLTRIWITQDKPSISVAGRLYVVGIVMLPAWVTLAREAVIVQVVNTSSTSAVDGTIVIAHVITRWLVRLTMLPAESKGAVAFVATVIVTRIFIFWQLYTCATVLTDVRWALVLALVTKRSFPALGTYAFPIEDVILTLSMCTRVEVWIVWFVGINTRVFRHASGNICVVFVGAITRGTLLVVIGLGPTAGLFEVVFMVQAGLYLLTAHGELGHTAIGVVVESHLTDGSSHRTSFKFCTL